TKEDGAVIISTVTTEKKGGWISDHPPFRFLPAHRAICENLEDAPPALLRPFRVVPERHFADFLYGRDCFYSAVRDLPLRLLGVVVMQDELGQIHEGPRPVGPRLTHPLRHRHARTTPFLLLAWSFLHIADQFLGVASPRSLYRKRTLCRLFGKRVLLGLLEVAADHLDDRASILPRRTAVAELLECVRSLVAARDPPHRCLPTTPSTCFAQRRS